MSSRTPPLSQARIFEAAAQVARRTGLENVTMRTVAEELGVTATALYHHVEDKVELFRGVIDLALSGVEVEGPDYGSWQDRFRKMAFDIDDIVSQYGPAMAMNFAISLTPMGERLMKAGLDLISESGLKGDRLHIAHSFFHIYTVGRLALRGQHFPSSLTAPGRRASRKLNPNKQPKALSRPHFAAAVEMFFVVVEHEVALQNSEAVSPVSANRRPRKRPVAVM